MICTDDFKELILSKWDEGQQDAATSDVDDIASFLAIDLAEPNDWHQFGGDSDVGGEAIASLSAHVDIPLPMRSERIHQLATGHPTPVSSIGTGHHSSKSGASFRI
ncbi:unnamed protein product [Tilletia controversa]|uniref:Uncharacterized protein n=2 Tax=Tilletia TaxID=13289 RepID=A0A8X7MYH0_9BASI|nr:hypothetical protein CF336_g7683 [Tilletia laevis]KAE8186944.1 hypothetical protein CF328_g7071 [Tilletia controversa]KAE8252549.1 hypothetical protein A4X06_0g2107 [Tilletia controversa]CAD6929579.1 unnamed protein product [Tilletia controversa]CAD6932095.1 unnamed protein product [Tilletia controversa]